jgi:hypothetical protein
MRAFFERCLCLGLVQLALTFVPCDVSAAILYASNDGVDGGACGSKGSPCRSIQQTIANAAAGDRIRVGAGRYGDLDDSGLLGDSPGEEIPSAACTTTFPGVLPNLCMVDIDKSLQLESEQGAGLTVLDAGGDASLVVRIVADDVVFGKRKKGFSADRRH